MPLQVRRGVEVERLAMTQPLAAGELLFVTNEQKLYVGDGTVLGGIQITGYTDDDAKDSAAVIFTAGTHGGITFTYNTAANLMSANVNLSDYAGTIKADAFKGSLFADDGSTVAGEPLVDAINGIFNGNLIGNVTGNITGTVTGNLIGNVTGSLVGNVTGDTAGYHTGDVKGSVFGSDSSTIIDASNGSITGNVTGTLQGEVSGSLKGSVFGDDSSIVIDSSTNTVIASSIITSLIVDPLGALFIGTTTSPTAATVRSAAEYPFTALCLTDGITPPVISLFVSKGTLVAPTSVLPGDELGGFSVRVYDGAIYKSAAVFNTSINVVADMTDDAPLSDLTLAVAAGGSNYTLFNLKGDGTFVAPGAVQLARYADDTARLAAIPLPVIGMMVFMQSGTAPTVTNKTVVYDGTDWVALH